MEAMRESWTDKRLDEVFERIKMNFDALEARFDALERLIARGGAVLIGAFLLLAAALVATKL